MSSSPAVTVEEHTVDSSYGSDLRRSGHSVDIGTFGAQVIRGRSPSRRASSVSIPSVDWSDIITPGAATPDPLLASLAASRAVSRAPSVDTEAADEVHEMSDLKHIATRLTSGGHMGDAFENLSRAITNQSYAEEGMDELKRTLSRRITRRMTPATVDGRRPSYLPGRVEEDGGFDALPKSQGVPPELPNLMAEIIFVAVVSAGQLLFSFLMGNVNVNQQAFKVVLGLQQGELPWLTGALLTALGLSVILSGSLTDILPPKSLIVGAFIWLTIWNVIAVFTLTPERAVLFFMTRAMQGLAVGVLVSGSMSILGRVYKPGLRKTRVFSSMAAAAPFGFWLGALQGGALSSHLEWIFGSNAIICGLFAGAAYATIPALQPVADSAGADAPTMKSFDFKGALCAIVGCVLFLFGLTQGSAADWAPYTYALIIVGAAILAVFFWLQTRVPRPLIPAKLWRTPGFAPLMLAYFLGLGGFLGAWQFYAVQFFLTQQHVSSLTVALYLLPNAVMGVLATWIVSRLMHRVPGHYIFLASMIAFGLGPAFFLPQTPSTSYWALSMPGIGLATFGPDLSFAAASIFITSNVSRSYQGSAGSLLVTIQNLSGAIMTSVADSIAAKVDTTPDGEIGLEGLRAAWWVALASSLAGAIITAVWVRIPKEVEKEHMT